MFYLIGYNPLWLIVACALGVVIGAATFQSHRERLMDGQVWAFVLAWVVGALIALARLLPDRAGYALELALLMAFVYAVGCFVGWVLRGATAEAEPLPAGHESGAALRDAPHHPAPHGRAASGGESARAAVATEAPKPAPMAEAPKPAPVVETPKAAPAPSPAPAAAKEPSATEVPVAEAAKPDASVEAEPVAPTATPETAIEAPDAPIEPAKALVAVEKSRPAVAPKAAVSPTPEVIVTPPPRPETPKPSTAPIEEPKPAPVAEAPKSVAPAKAAKLSAIVETVKPAAPVEPTKKAAAPEAPKAETSEPVHQGARPAGLAAPRGTADDLKRIRGIGPQNEGRLHGLGIWHFDQIAAWTPENVEWVGSYLAFPGRIDREEWLVQAKVLAEGRETEFSKRVDAGDVPTSKNDGSAGQSNIERVAPKKD